MKYLRIIFFILLLIVIKAYSEHVMELLKSDDPVYNESITAPQDTSFLEAHPNENIITALDSLSKLPYFSLCTTCNVDSLEAIKALRSKDYPKFGDDVYKERLKLIDQNSPFRLVHNQEVQKYIELYAYKRRYHTAKVLGLSDMYFPIFEETLDKYDLPLEFKYLAVVESALNPRIKSGAGAVGLWQFILTTGKAYGLKVTSYEDQRCDPYLATDAACRYFKYLYNIYNDWELVLAAYNCGPGNVNKAIRRSGYKKNYWQLWPYLPKETRGYVPAFIAVNYIMTFSDEHEIFPLVPDRTYFDYDTLQVHNRVDLSILANELDIPLNALAALNPSYKLNIIPKGKKKRNLYLPVTKIGDFLDKESNIFALSRESHYGDEPMYPESQITHYVQDKEDLANIASRYGCTENDIIKWNNLKSTFLQSKQKLIVGFIRDEHLELASSQAN